MPAFAGHDDQWMRRDDIVARPTSFP